MASRHRRPRERDISDCVRDAANTARPDSINSDMRAARREKRAA